MSRSIRRSVRTDKSVSFAAMAIDGITRITKVASMAVWRSLAARRISRKPGSFAQRNYFDGRLMVADRFNFNGS